MTLTPQQLAALRSDLTTLVQIDYEHLRNELLDHYATLTEEKMEAGLSFYEAHTVAWQEMGATKGIRKIQEQYESVTRTQIEARHHAIMKSYLRWPTVVTTLLVATLVTYLLLVLPMHPVRIMTGVLVVSPVFVMVVAAAPYYFRKDSRQKLIWDYITQRGNLPTALLNFLNVYGLTTDQEPSRLTMTCIMLLAGASLYLTVSLAQLMREHFSFKLT